MQKQTFTFTQEGYDNILDEKKKLIERRPQVVINLSNAREQGDLSENAGYHAAKDELSQIDSRLRELEYIIRNAQIVESTQADTVSFGSTVKVEHGGRVGNLRKFLL